MKYLDLLDHVQPDNGCYCILGIGSFVKQELVATREEFNEVVDTYLAEKRDVYFGVAKFKSVDGGRKKQDVQSLKAFWLDIDCGENKAEINEKTGIPDGYVDQAAGFKKLREFVETVGLPPPTIVNSGRGLHVYWALTSEVTKEQWEPVGKRLNELCKKQEFYVDPSVFEVARVLRVPGTLNFKDDPPKPVEILGELRPPIDFDEFKDILGVKEKQPAIEVEPSRKSALRDKLMENIQSNFAKIMTASAKGSGCKQLLSCYMDRKTLSEPRWWNALSVAANCADRDTAIHILSRDYPDYAPEEVNKKVKHITGPHSCEEFEKNNSGGCEGCPHRGKIKTPIQLGNTFVAATDSDIPDAPEETEEEEEAEPTKPSYTHPYYRGKNGGIYRIDDLNDEEAKPVFIYEYDLYVKKRMTDPNDGDIVVFVLHTPKDGVREFSVNNSTIAQPMRIREALAKEGVLATNKQFDLIVAYVIHAVVENQKKRKAELMRRQFGWHDGDTKFVVGDMEITVSGVYHSPPSSVTKSLVPHFEPQGSLDKWKEVFALYGMPGMEVQAFGALTGFGAPLLKFTGQKGAIINLIHSSAGTGKTTILRMANSIYGDPEKLLGTVDDTKTAKITKLGILNNIVNTVDEITNTKGDEFSELVYAFSQGKGKEKSERHETKLRMNTTTWNTPTLTSSNASMYDKLAAIKKKADGEVMRLLEFRIDYTDESLISTATGKEMFDHQLNANYGHAIVPFIQYILANKEEVLATLQSVQARIDKDLKFTSRERNWSAVVSANITGGLIAERIGLFTDKEGEKTWDMLRIYKAVLRELSEMRTKTTAPVANAPAIVSDYIHRNINNMLVINGNVDKRTHLATDPIVEPRHHLYIRYEPDTKLMYLSVNAFSKDCSEYQVEYTDTINQLKGMGICLGTDNKRLSKGTNIPSASVRCVILNCDHSEFISMEGILPDDLKDESRESDVRD